jgi:hypothetical protein
MGVNSYVLIKPTYWQKSQRWPVSMSMVVLAVDERLEAGNSVETLDSVNIDFEIERKLHLHCCDKVAKKNRANGVVEIDH